MFEKEFDNEFFNWLFDEITNQNTLTLMKENAYSSKTPSKWSQNYTKLEKLYSYLLSISHLDLIDSPFIKFKYGEYYYQIAYIHEDYHSSLLVRYLLEKPEEYIDLNKEQLDKKKNYRALYVLVNPDFISEDNKIRDISNLITKTSLEYVSKNPNNQEVKAWLNSECKVILLESNSRIMETWQRMHGGCFFKDKNNKYKYVTVGIIEKDNAIPLVQHFKPMF